MAVPLFSAKPLTYFHIFSRLFLCSAQPFRSSRDNGSVKQSVDVRRFYLRGHSLQAKLCPLQSTTSLKMDQVHGTRALLPTTY